MPHMNELLVEKTKKSKIIGFDVRILDDNTFVMNVRNSDYAKNKEYSYPSIEAVIKGIREDFGNNKESKKDEDELKRKTE